MSSRRRERLNEMIRRHVSSRLLADVKDPRVGFVTVIRTEILEDFREAKVYVSILDEGKKKKETLMALNQMRGFFQKDLSKVLGTRVTPVLTFKVDDGAEKAVSLDSLINKARETDPDHLYGHIGDDASEKDSSDDDQDRIEPDDASEKDSSDDDQDRIEPDDASEKDSSDDDQDRIKANLDDANGDGEPHHE